MKYWSNLLNGTVLLLFGLWGYLTSESPSPTALIPVFIGATVLALHPGLRKDNRSAAHMVASLTVLMIFGLLKPLTGVIERGDTLGIFRVVTMICTSIFAFAQFTQAFLRNRAKNKQGQA
ncbi:MAG: hypothetical protein AAGA85_12635 [Bacteroidota bacterium]